MNRIKPAAVILLLLAVIIPMTAQRLRTRQKTSAPKTTVATTRPAKKVEKASRPKLLLPDTVYSAYTAKQHGWFSPLTILTKEQARLNNKSYRFTNRNAQGRWLKMEVVNGRGNYVGGQMSPYILKLNTADSDSTANKDWVEKLQTTCIYEFVPSPTGDILQERAYDRDHNLVYIYSRTPIGEKDSPKKYIGSYRDIYGLPAEMRKDTLNQYTYGTLVMITEDRWGNDSIIEYMDARGIKKPNSDGVAMEIYVSDKSGYLLRQESRNADGYRVIDNAGNCGLEYEWKEGELWRQQSKDAEWKPICMPLTSITGGTSGVEYKYDKYGRQISMGFLDLDGSPKENYFGVARIEDKFNDFGDMVQRRYYGIDGSLQNWKYGWATERYEYDDKGNGIVAEYLDKNGHPQENDKFLSKIVNEYDNDGKLIKNQKFIGVNGTHQLVYQEINTPFSTHYTYYDGSTQVDSTDSKGRETLSAFYNLDGNRMMGGDGYALKIVKYEELNKGCIETSEYFDEHLRPIGVDGVNGASKIITRMDSISGLKQIWRYLPDGTLFETYIHHWNPKDASEILGQSDANAFGVTTRAGGSSGVNLYYADALKTQKGEFSTLVGRDEFGEPDYIYGDGFLYYYKRIGEGDYDEFNERIVDVRKMKDELPKVFTIEVVDSIAYRLGFKDNDVIIVDGDYVNIPTNDVELANFKAKRIYAMNGQAQRPRKMIVFRIDPFTKEYDLIEIDGIVGYDSQNGFIAHVKYLTEKQRSRIEECCKKSDLINEKQYSDGKSYDSVRGENLAVVEMSEMFRADRIAPYGKQIKDPSVVLAISIPDLGMSWVYGDSIDRIGRMLVTRKKNRPSYPEIIHYVVKDGKHIEKLCTTDQLVMSRIMSVNVNDSIYHSYDALAKEAADCVIHDMAPLVRLPRGRYQLETDTANNFQYELEIVADKNGLLDIKGHAITRYVESGKAYLFNTTIDNGIIPVVMDGNMIPLGDYSEYECEGIIVGDDLAPDEDVARVNSMMAADESLKQYVISRMEWQSPGMSAMVRLIKNADGSYALEDESGRIVPLQRVGKK